MEVWRTGANWRSWRESKKGPVREVHLCLRRTPAHTQSNRGVHGMGRGAQGRRQRNGRRRAMLLTTAIAKRLCDTLVAGCGATGITTEAASQASRQPQKEPATCAPACTNRRHNEATGGTGCPRGEALCGQAHRAAGTALSVQRSIGRVGLRSAIFGGCVVCGMVLAWNQQRPGMPSADALQLGRLGGACSRLRAG